MGRRGRPNGGARRSRRPLLLALPLVAVSLAVFSLAANNDDLTGLRAGAGPTTLVPADEAAGAAVTTTDPAENPAETATTVPGTGAGATDGVDGGTGVTGTGSAVGPGATSADGSPRPTVGAGAGTLGANPVTTAPGATVPDAESGGTSTPATGADGSPGSAPTATAGPGATTASDPGATVPGQQPTGATGAGTGTATAEGTDTTVEPTDTADGGGLGGTIRSLAMVVGLAVAATAAIYLSASILQAVLQLRRRGPEDGDDLDDEGDGLEPITINPAVAGWTLERLRAELEAEPDPRLAVRKAYAVVESGFGAGGGLARRRTETPLQYIERTLGTVDGATRPLRVLTGLFLLARFSNRPMNQAMRRAAIDAVVELQAQYRSAEDVAA